jgi:hypothetical protein
MIARSRATIERLLIKIQPTRERSSTNAAQKYPVAASAAAVMGAILAAPAGVGWTPSALSAVFVGSKSLP